MLGSHLTVLFCITSCDFYCELASQGQNSPWWGTDKQTCNFGFVVEYYNNSNSINDNNFIWVSEFLTWHKSPSYWGDVHQVYFYKSKQAHKVHYKNSVWTSPANTNYALNGTNW